MNCALGLAPVAHATTPTSSLKLYVNQSPLRTSLPGVAPGQAVRVELTLRNQLNVALSQVRVQHTLPSGMKWVSGTVQGLSFEPVLMSGPSGTCGALTALSAPGTTQPVFELASMPAAPTSSYSTCALLFWAMLPPTATPTSYNSAYDLSTHPGDLCSDGGSGYCNTNTDTETSAPITPALKLAAALSASGTLIDVTFSNATAFDISNIHLGLEIDGVAQPGASPLVATARANQGLASGVGLTTVQLPFTASAGTHTFKITATQALATHADGSTQLLASISKTISVTLAQAVQAPALQPQPQPEPTPEPDPETTPQPDPTAPTEETPAQQTPPNMSPYLQALSNQVLAEENAWLTSNESTNEPTNDPTQTWHLNLQIDANAHRTGVAYAGHITPADQLTLGLAGASDDVAATTLQHGAYASLSTQHQWQGWHWSTRSHLAPDQAQVSTSVQRHLSDELQAGIELGGSWLQHQTGNAYTAAVARYHIKQWQLLARAEAPTGRVDLGAERPWWWGSVVYGRFTRYAGYPTAEAAASVGTVNTLTHPLVVPSGEMAVGLRWQRTHWRAYAEQRQLAGAQLASWAAGAEWNAQGFTHRVQAWSDQGLPTRALHTLQWVNQPAHWLRVNLTHQAHHDGAHTTQQLVAALSLKHDWVMPWAPTQLLRAHTTTLARHELTQSEPVNFAQQTAYGLTWRWHAKTAPVGLAVGYNFKGFADSELALANATHAGWHVQLQVGW